jgi:hypothetical protein
MKVLFNNHTPFMLAHGGAQIQIEQKMAALGRAGVEVEPLRWWDDRAKQNTNDRHRGDTVARKMPYYRASAVALQA